MNPNRTLLDMNRYQWVVLFAAWLGWGFDVFDGLLFNYVAPNCVPALLGIQDFSSKEAKSATLFWTGILTSILLIGWGVGGIIFGRVADKIGRTKTLLLTMSLYAVGTALCAIAPNMGFLIVCRILASLGIGGEWAAGAAMVAEVVPEKRRVEAGALLYTSAPFGLFLATFLTYKIQGEFFKGSPETSWRYVFLCGLLPALVAFLVRLFVKEPERWVEKGAQATASIRELFTPEFRRTTLGGLAMAIVALLMWWSCNAFIPTVANGLAGRAATAAAMTPDMLQALKESWKQTATNSFNLGGLVGTLLTIPVAKHVGRKAMFIIYFIGSAVAIMTTFGLPMDDHTRLYLYFFIGLTVFGIFGSFTFYLPELFPTRLRATGAGFCYNAGRFVAAFGPFLVGAIASQGADSLRSAIQLLFWIGLIPVVGVLFVPFIDETRHRMLAD